MKQQTGELIGVVVSAIAIGGVLYLLSTAWGYGSQELPAPQATLMKMVVEGVYSAKAAIALGKKYQVDLPIIEQVNAVLFENRPAKEAVTELMMRDKKAENDDLEWE